MKIKVEKRDKKIEIYQPEKILKVVRASGLSQDDAEKLTQTMTSWLKNKSLSKVTSLQIRDQVLVQIQKISKVAARKFIWYEKYKDKNYGINF